MENTFGNELREFNCLYKEVDEIYHEIALKMGISDSGFIILYALAEWETGACKKILRRFIISASRRSILPSAILRRMGMYASVREKAAICISA